MAPRGWSGTKPESIAWAWETAWRLQEQQNDRLRALDGKAAQVAGFAGVVLALLATLAPQGIEAELGCPGEAIFLVSYGLAAVLLVFAIAWLLFRVFRPKQFVTISGGEIRRYLDEEKFFKSKPWGLQVRTMRGLADAIERAENVGNRKATDLKLGVACFACGLGASLSAIAAFVIGSS